MAVSLLFLLALLPAAAAAQGPGPITDGHFVHADGTRFALDAGSFHVIGANVAVMHGRDQRDGMRDTLQAAAADRLSIVRLWALGEYPADAPASVRDRAFRIGPDGWVDESYAHLDRVLVEARRLQLRVVIVLSNRWGDYGGVSQYLRWDGQPPVGRHAEPLELTAFWSCAGCEARYQEHVRRIVGRVNAITGVRYADDPTIFSWELMNEAEGAGPRGEASMVAWLDRQAQFVRALDANHMISAGHIGYQQLRDRALWTRVCSLPSITYCDSHAYPLRPGRVRSAALLARWIDDRVQLAHYVARKPLLFGEFGVPADRRAVYGRQRTDWLSLFVRRVVGNGAAGAMLWTYLPSGAPRTYAVYAHGEHESLTADIRRALAQQSQLARARLPHSINGSLRPEEGDVLLYDPTVRLRGPGTIHSRWRAEANDLLLRIDPIGFERAHFEGCGTWLGNPGLPHFYGNGRGSVSYRLRTPRATAPSALTVRLRASSELPGAGVGATDADTSALVVLLDGVDIGSLTAPPDDGNGGWVELTVTDPNVLRALTRRTVHRLEVRASGDGAGGVCLYEQTDAGEPAGIEVRWRR